MSLWLGVALTEKAQQSLGVLIEGLTFHVPQWSKLPPTLPLCFGVHCVSAALQGARHILFSAARSLTMNHKLQTQGSVCSKETATTSGNTAQPLWDAWGCTSS